jgi:hypothetical protein
MVAVDLFIQFRVANIIFSKFLKKLVEDLFHHIVLGECAKIFQHLLMTSESQYFHQWR